MDSFTEDSTSFSCEYCGQEFGTLSAIMQENVLSNHNCLKNSDNLNLNYETGMVSKCDTNQNKIIVPTIKTNAAVPSFSREMGPSPSDAWTDNAVKLLVDAFKLHRVKFDSPCYSKKKVWELISLEMSKFGYQKSGVKCDEKWRNLRKTYDKVLKDRNKTGNSNITWKFYDDFQEIYWRDPHFVPIATASTSGVSTQRKFDNVETEESRKNLSPGENRKRRLFTTSEIEERRQKRHEEKMQLKKEMFEWFKENFKKE